MAEISSKFWQASLQFGMSPAAPLIDVIEQAAEGLSSFENADGSWTVTALYRAQPDAGALGGALALVAAAHGLPEPALDIALLPPADWLADAYAGFPPRHIGHFYVHGSHLQAPNDGALKLRIDAATAFGSGEHATTEGCLLAISALARRRRNIGRVLDMGTGSGILAVAAAKVWRTARIVAVDIDSESARVAAANARLNGVGGRIRAVQGDGYKAPLAARGPAFDLVVENILARPLIRMAPFLQARLAHGGVAVLSGLLRRQEPAVLAAHLAVGLRLVGRRPVGEWQTLILRRA